jgi:hypothetical protein
MTGARKRISTGYARFLAAAVLVAAAVGAAGYLPTLVLGGAAAVPALVAGCAVAVAASAVGGVPIALSAAEPASRPQAALLAMVARLLTALAWRRPRPGASPLARWRCGRRSATSRSWWSTAGTRCGRRPRRAARE